MSQQLFLAPIVHAPTRDTLETAHALVSVVDGRIAWVERLDTTNADVSVTAAGAAARRGVSLDDAVVHAPQYQNNGLGHSLQLLEWLDTLTFPLEKKFKDDNYARKVYTEVVRRNLAAGTTTACYYASLHVQASLTLAQVAIDAGQRALVGRCSMDRCCPHDYVESGAHESMASTEQFLANFPTCSSSSCNSPNATAEQPLVRPILTPRFAISCTPALLGALGDLAAARDLPIQTHISENAAEIAEVRRLFPDQKSYAGVYDAFGLLTSRTILAHGVHLSSEEIGLITKRGAGVSHCPTSNININSGSARVLALLDAGVTVGLGSDCSGGPATGILAAVRSADTVSRCLAFAGLAKRGLSVPEMWHLATRGGAALAGVNAGAFEVGMEFDALWIRPRGPGTWAVEGESTRHKFDKWLFAGDDRDIGAVWVRGRCVSGAPPA